MDCLKKYTATSDFYVFSGSSLTLNDGIFSTSGNVMILNPNTSTRYWTSPITVEFDVNTVNNLTTQIGETTNVFNRRLSTLGATNGSHIKIVYDGTTVTPYVNGVEKTSYKVDFSFTTQYYFNIYNSGAFSNFIVY